MAKRSAKKQRQQSGEQAGHGGHLQLCCGSHWVDPDAGPPLPDGGPEEDAAATAAIIEHVREIDDAFQAEDYDLEMDISNDGLTVHVAGYQWELCHRPEDNAWYAMRPTHEGLFDSFALGDGDLTGTVGPIDLPPDEIVRRLRTGELQHVESS